LTVHGTRFAVASVIEPVAEPAEAVEITLSFQDNVTLIDA
jgi:hypothetical protein